ncbi:methyltransferase domain-containing protein [Buchnera aphidicola (Thelaxes californica)]|uniref:Methyltransferase domain-containing protein n=2 Tax=Buchnera aphidicola TaxID=9 RepID=A0A4D6YM48_9GAMM|nr:methyltransferase domain-containing protein [Buchnera aphidicola (Thelaxes californica)]
MGKNKSGVKNSVNIFKKHIVFKKVKSMRKCSLFYGKKMKHFIFSMNKYYNNYCWNGIFLFFLPGVFGFKKIDAGTELLISTLKNLNNKKILDLCCGSGIIGIFIAKNFKQIKLQVCDNSKSALISSRINFSLNKVNGKIIKSNLFTNVTTKFDMIVSNPPYHDDLSSNINFVKEIINKSNKYLKSKGEMRFVVNKFLNIEKYLKKNFYNFFIVKKSKRFIVYSFLKTI